MNHGGDMRTNSDADGNLVPAGSPSDAVAAPPRPAPLLSEQSDFLEGGEADTMKG